MRGEAPLATPRSPSLLSPPMRRTLLLMISAGLVACAEPQPKSDLSDKLTNVPLPPGAEGLGREDGESAVQLRFKTPLAVDAVADYYRQALNRAPWRLINESKTQDGGVAFYAEQNGPPLWVSIRPGGGLGTLVDLAGAKIP